MLSCKVWSRFQCLEGRMLGRAMARDHIMALTVFFSRQNLTASYDVLENRTISGSYNPARYALLDQYKIRFRENKMDPKLYGHGHNG